MYCFFFLFFKQKTAYEMRISDWSSDVCSSDLFGYSFLYENQDTLQAVTVNGVEPNPETIASGDYGVSRPLFIYIKNAHRGVIPGLSEFVEEYMSEAALGPDGYLAERGRSEEHTSELQSLMRISYAVFCLKTKQTLKNITELQLDH